MTNKRRKNRATMRGTDRSSMPPPDNKAFYTTTLASLNRQKAIRLVLPIERKNHLNMPYGYIVDEDNPHMLKPIQEIFELLVQAVAYLKRGYTLVDTAEWLNSNPEVDMYEQAHHTGRTLGALMKTRPPFKEAALPLDEKERL